MKLISYYSLLLSISIVLTIYLFIVLFQNLLKHFQTSSFNPFFEPTSLIHLKYSFRSKKKKNQWYEYTFSSSIEIKHRHVSESPICPRLVSIPVLLINFKSMRNPTHWETTSCACRPRPGSDYALDCSLASRIRYLRIDTCNCLRSTHSRSLNNRAMSIQK